MAARPLLFATDVQYMGTARPVTDGVTERRLRAAVVVVAEGCLPACMVQWLAAMLQLQLSAQQQYVKPSQSQLHKGCNMPRNVFRQLHGMGLGSGFSGPS